MRHELFKLRERKNEHIEVDIKQRTIKFPPMGQSRGTCFIRFQLYICC